MKNYRSYVRFLIAATMCLIVGCAGVHSRKPYSSPHGNFVVPIPESGVFGGETPRIKEDSDDLGGRVVFCDTTLYWFLRSITYRRLPAEPGGVSRAAGEREAQVRSFLHDYAFPELFEPVSRDTEILLEETIWTANVVEYFAVVRIPEGSIMTDGAGKRQDSVRALLIFPHGGYMYMLGLANMTWGVFMMPPAEMAEVMDPVDYQAREFSVQRIEDIEKRQREFDKFVAQARKWLAEFKSTIAFK
ncbi:MAG: hypothetical protein JSW58_09395 [Candidatus Latescibacterota bacterium]|nr:MAG: hypothetical protein JSW58_09395 [Candidatus Latescibacterota bacterium]